MNRFFKLLTSLLLLALPLFGREKPNIVIFLADDLGYGDCGAFNSQSKIKMPHIDRLAEEGMRFTDAHSASATCTPSRYGLLTGINPVRTGVFNTLLKTGRPIIHKDEMTLADLLKVEDYETWMVGKWHLGFENKSKSLDLSQDLRGGPLDCGFDYFFGLASSASSSPLCFIKNRKIQEVSSEFVEVDKIRGSGQKSKYKIAVPKDLKLEDVSPRLSENAVGLIQEYAKSAKEQPFLLYFASIAPHQPWVPSENFKGKSGLGVYADFVMQMDDELGQINQALKDTGLEKNTIVIFTSDNGTGPGAHYLMAEQGHHSSGPMRGAKASSYEGGHRMPFIAKWPGIIPVNSQSKAVINATDIFATIAELLKVDLKEKYPQVAPDSFSFYKNLINLNQKQSRPSMVVRESIRMGDWKLISSGGKKEFDSLKMSQFKLYNLSSDLAEKNDLAPSHPERAQEMYKEFKKFMDQRKLKENQ
ncbi:arylsulfatase precursor [Lentisphaera araneosa HTCC2155]|uniref:Arylsulfatase n=1 Tax=Lentisphaera araneosa HTCC2155 TaxID=313628 RepID=A6DG39_9BACT|nr:arylsulfatase [Lentisphaera araneosa]EDM29156.1 arylsulfatase precursor [Lentisphaera araneosa HTCC2155]